MNYKNIVLAAIVMTLLLISSCQTFRPISVDYKKRTYDGVHNEFYVAKEPISGQLNVNIEYYTFFEGKIVKNKGGVIGMPLHGQFHKINSGMIIESGVFWKGRKDGRWIRRNMNGDVISLKNWKKGILNGKQVQTTNGMLHTAVYKMGKIIGTEVFENDSLRITNNYKDGVRLMSDTINLNARAMAKVEAQKPKVEEVQNSDTIK